MSRPSEADPLLLEEPKLNVQCLSSIKQYLCGTTVPPWASASSCKASFCVPQEQCSPRPFDGFEQTLLLRASCGLSLEL